ncbi:hypothetical protein [Klebsiella phage vB_KshKPC-M]|nr:hypothetical protein [Klebsiella phage vB_KshKPC-M]
MRKISMKNLARNPAKKDTYPGEILPRKVKRDITIIITLYL